jgi:hypothetical protein
VLTMVDYVMLKLVFLKGYFGNLIMNAAIMST